VNAASDPGSDPTIVLPTLTDFTEGDLVNFNFVVLDPDDDIISVEITGLPSDATWNAGTYEVLWVTGLTDAGQYVLSITATDSRGGSDTEQLIITVLDNGDPPEGDVHKLHLRNVNITVKVNFN
jgi:hypothetical protein